MEFDALQERLVSLWSSIGMLSDEDQTIVVVPSINVDDSLLGHFAELIPAYEERYLMLLLLLRQREARLVYVTSVPVPQSIVDYYLHLVPDVPPEDARAR